MRDYALRIFLSCLPFWEGIAFTKLWTNGHWPWALAVSLAGSVAFFALLDAYCARKRGEG